MFNKAKNLNRNSSYQTIKLGKKPYQSEFRQNFSDKKFAQLKLLNIINDNKLNELSIKSKY